MTKAKQAVLFSHVNPPGNVLILPEITKYFPLVFSMCFCHKRSHFIISLVLNIIYLYTIGLQDINLYYNRLVIPPWCASYPLPPITGRARPTKTTTMTSYMRSLLFAKFNVNICSLIKYFASYPLAFLLKNDQYSL